MARFYKIEMLNFKIDEAKKSLTVPSEYECN